jgi:esterase
MTPDQPSSLSVSRVAGADAPARQLVMMHGIYGRGRNLQALARGVTASRPEYACWLVDLPSHGDSGPSTHGSGVRGFAADVEEWLTSQRLTADAILGHSFGGKVALAMADQLRDHALQLWIIDSTPEVKTPSGSAWDMLRIVRALPAHVRSRNDVVKAIVGAGFALEVAQWMSTNLTRVDDGFAWRLDFDVMERLLQDFFVTDLWHVVEHPSPHHDIHFLKASHSSAISPDAVRRITAAASDHIHLHGREGGHWIHAESPQVVIDLLVEHLP